MRVFLIVKWTSKSKLFSRSNEKSRPSIKIENDGKVEAYYSPCITDSESQRGMAKNEALLTRNQDVCSQVRQLVSGQR